MTSPALQTLEKVLGFSTNMDATHEFVWHIFQNKRLSEENWPAIQAKCINLFAAAADLIETNAHHMPTVQRLSAKFYGAIGLLWVKYQQSDHINPSLRADIAAVLSCAIDTMGLPDDSALINLVGIAPALDEQVVQEVIAHTVMSTGLNIDDRDIDSEDDWETNNHFRQLNNLICALCDSGSTTLAIDLVESLGLLKNTDPAMWRSNATFELSLSLFRTPLSLDDEQIARMKRFFADLDLTTVNVCTLSASVDQLVNIAKSGLNDIIEPLLESQELWVKVFSIHNPHTILVDIERHTSLDVGLLVAQWARMLNSQPKNLKPGVAKTIQQMIIGYQLLNAHPHVQENLLDFKKGMGFEPISEVAGAVSTQLFDVAQYPINTQHLTEIVAEFIAKQPQAINDMARDQHLHEIVTSLPGWFTHQLETDLGL